jgi:hypothetical protein
MQIRKIQAEAEDKADTEDTGRYGGYRTEEIGTYRFREFKRI